MESETIHPISKEFTENISNQISWKFKPVYHFVYKNIERGRDYSMSKFESKLYEDTSSEISRLEGELDFLRQFLKLVGSSPEKPTKSISKPSTKSPAAKSAQKKTTKTKKPKLTKSGKKIGRPTNAEKEVREREEVEYIDNKSTIKDIAKFEKDLS